MEEIWKPVVGYEGLYEVSNFGKVRSLNWHYQRGNVKNMTTFVNRCGYEIVTLSLKGKLKTYKVHTLVAKAFIDNPDNLPVVNHLDENKLNNNVSNLEWCTQGDNIRHGTSMLRSSMTKSKKPILQCKDGEIVQRWSGIKEIEKHGYYHTTLLKCLRGERDTYRGYEWHYA